MNILGTSGYYHDSAAAFLCDGEIVAAAQEERFSRKKHDARFPKRAIAYRLKEAKVSLQNVDQVVFLWETSCQAGAFIDDLPRLCAEGLYVLPCGHACWLKEKLYLKEVLRILMGELFKDLWEFMKERKVYWMAPVVIILVLLGGLIILTQGSAVAPFIYTLFQFLVTYYKIAFKQPSQLPLPTVSTE